ncbi:MAG: hypothetical protein KDK76_02635 [Chlamydiia bacterium]|nr:hypothetical protein [Chlamydiia bacterium]
MEDKGVLTGCNQEQEWMLKWWWNHYSKHNDYPVTFCDFGMSLPAKKWCEKRGNVLTYNPQFLLKEKSQKAPWANHIAMNTWNKRHIWFSKAFILEKSPYEKTVWTDLDCEILQNIAPLFEMTACKDGFAIAHDSDENNEKARHINILKEGVQGLQVGVLSFTKGSPVIPAWINYCMKHLDTEISEQTAISHLLHKTPFDITTFSSKYNWLIPENSTSDVVIKHHTGHSRKRKLFIEMKFDG